MDEDEKKKLRVMSDVTVVRDSPYASVLLEDATSARHHGRLTARVGVGANGNPIVYSTDQSAGDAVAQSIQRGTGVSVMRIPEVTEIEFKGMILDGARAMASREQPHGLSSALLPASPPVTKTVSVERSYFDALGVDRRVVDKPYRVEIERDGADRLIVSQNFKTLVLADRWAKSWNRRQRTSFKATVQVYKGTHVERLYIRARTALKLIS